MKTEEGWLKILFIIMTGIILSIYCIFIRDLAMKSHELVDSNNSIRKLIENEGIENSLIQLMIIDTQSRGILLQSSRYFLVSLLITSCYLIGIVIYFGIRYYKRHYKRSV